MGLLSIFQRNKQTAAKPAKAARGGKAAARQAPLNNTANPAGTAEAVREARARARRRLMGATVLLLVGVIGFPLLFETQPRPIPVDLPIEIPSRDGSPTALSRDHHAGVSAAATAAIPASAIEPESVSYDARTSAPVTPLPASAGQVGPRKSAFASLAAALTSSGAHANDPAPTPRPVLVEQTAAAPVARTPPAPATPVAPKPAPQVPAVMPPVAVAAHDTPHDAAKPAARPSEAGADAARFVVQIGAFADDAKMREARGKVERLGLKTYTQAVDTPSGKRVRVRVGPYPTKAEADKAASKIKSGGLSAAAVLAL